MSSFGQIKGAGDPRTGQLALKLVRVLVFGRY